MTFKVRCVEKLPSGNWRVQALDETGAERGRAFVLVERTGRWKTPCVLWMADPRSGRVVEARLPDYRALRHRQLVGDELYEAEKRRQAHNRKLRKAGADMSQWDRRLRSARKQLSTSEHALANFGGEPLLTMADVEAHGGRVIVLRVPEQFDPTGKGIPMAFWGGRFRGRVHGEDAVERANGSILSPSGSPTEDSRGSDRVHSPEEDEAGVSGSGSVFASPEPTSGS